MPKSFTKASVFLTSVALSTIAIFIAASNPEFGSLRGHTIDSDVSYLGKIRFICTDSYPEWRLAIDKEKPAKFCTRMKKNGGHIFENILLFSRDHKVVYNYKLYTLG